MVIVNTGEIRIPPKLEANWLRKAAIQLDFFDVIRENVVKTETNGAVTPPPPNQSGGISSTMTYGNSTPTTTHSQVSERPTYSQDWRNYTLAQTNEKQQFLTLLKDLCSTVPQPEQGKGRPRLPLSDMIFAATFKVYSGFSARRFTGDIEAALRDGLIDHAPNFNTTNRYLANPALTPILKSLIETSAAPLASVETDFAIDSTGFSTTTYDRWFDHKWGKVKSKQVWAKAHLMTGVRTNIVTAAHCTAGESADSPQLPVLLEATAQTFDTISDVSADKAYLSKQNFRAIEAVGGTAYIPFKVNSTPSQSHHVFDGVWSKAWHYYNLNRDEFLAHYHKRSNAETTMMMVKTKFGGAVKSKSPTAQVNEVLCKVLAHNICVLIQSFYELGIESHFSPSPKPESKVIDLNQYRMRMAT